MQGMHSTPKALPCEFCRFWTLVVFFSGPGHQVEAAAARWSKASTKSSGKAMGGFQAKGQISSGDTPMWSFLHRGRVRKR